MSSFAAHAAYRLASRWHLLMWAPLIGVFTAALPDRAWAPATAIFLSVGLAGLAVGLAVSGRPDQERLWRSVGSPLERVAARVAVDLSLLAPGALLLDRWHGVHMATPTGAWPALLVGLYGVLSLGRALGRAWALVGLLVGCGGLLFDLAVQAYAGTWSGIEDLRRSCLTLGIGSLLLCALWDAWLGPWGFAVRRRRFQLVAAPLAALLLLPPLLDAWRGPVRYAVVGAPMLSADGQSSLRLVRTDAWIIPGPVFAFLWRDGVERRVGPINPSSASLGPAGSMSFVRQTDDGWRAWLSTSAGVVTCDLPASDDAPWPASWRPDGGAVVIAGGRALWLISADGECPRLESGAEGAVWAGNTLSYTVDSTLVFGDDQIPLSAEGARLIAVGEHLYTFIDDGEGHQSLDQADVVGEAPVLSGEALELALSPDAVCARAARDERWTCADKEGKINLFDQPSGLHASEGHATAQDGTRWTLPADADADPPMVRLDATTLRVATPLGIDDITPEGEVVHHAFVGADQQPVFVPPGVP